MTHQRRIRVSLIAAAIITALSVPPAVAAQPCSFDPSTRTVTVNVDPTIPSRWFLDQAGDVSGTIRVVPGNQAPVSCGATANDADSIVITDVTPGGRTDLRIQLFPAWGPGFTDEPGSSDEVEFVVNLGGGRDILDFNALVSPEPQNIRFGGKQFNLNSAEADGIDADGSLQGVELVTVVGGTAVNRISGAGGKGTPGKPLAVRFASIQGGEGEDVLVGGKKNDLIEGKGGDDRILGKLGDDKLKGDSGADRLDGGPGKDACTGGPGKDRFRRCEQTKR